MKRLLLFFGLLACLSEASARPICHIHPPAVDGAATSPPTIGPYESGEACERTNALMFAGQGRCHCAFDLAAMASRPSLPRPPADLEEQTFEYPGIR